MKVRAVLLVALLAVAGAGGFGIYEHLRAKTVTYRLDLVTSSDSTPPLKLFADGHELGLFVRTVSDLLVSSRPHRSFDPAMMQPSFAAKVLLPCGWRDLAVTVEQAPTAVELKDAAREKRDVRLRLSAARMPAPMVEFWTDNRGGPEARLAVGQSWVTIPAGVQRRFDLPASDCPEGAAVTLNANTIGQLPLELAREDFGHDIYSLGGGDFGGSVRDSRVYLLDVSGARCYLITERKYAKPGQSTFGFAPGETQMSYRRKHLH
ncbi:MAG: hypothetical protein ACRD2M_05370, partial [Terriglobales bacterium]